MVDLYLEGPDALTPLSDLGVNSFEDFRDGSPPQAKQLVACNPEGYLISFNRPALRATVETVGVDHPVFGTDYAFDEEDTDTIVADFRAVVTDDDDRRRVASETVRTLFDL
jgi:hypothetical protein